MSNDIRGKVAFITGGASGIGLATAKRLIEEGAKVAIGDINLDAAKASAASIGALAVEVDQSNEVSVKAAVEFVEKTFGGLDLAVNGAAVQGQVDKITNLEADDVARVTAVNLNGIIFAMKHEVLTMKKRGGGAIVNIASAVGMRPAPHSATYSASKAGVIAITQVAAAENAPSHIRINSVSTGYIDTPMLRATGIADGFVASCVPLGRMGKASEIAEASVFLLSPKAQYICGSNLVIDGGLLAAGLAKLPDS